MKKTLVLVIAFLVIGLLAGSAQAQSIQDRLQSFGQDYAKGYVGPLGDQFGAALNSGWFHNANISDGLDIYIGVKVMLMPLPDGSKTFGIQSLWPGGGVDKAPTVFGPKEDVLISGAPASADPHVYPQGLDMNWSALPVPHISIGNIFGTRLMIRFLPQIPLGDAGNLGFFGIGAQHSISRYIPLVPLDISAHVAYSSFTLGDLISATGFNFGVEASKSFAILTVYGGVGYETSKFSFSYNASYTDPANPANTITQAVGFDINGTNSVRATVGFALSLGFLKINADYSAASQSVIVGGIGIGI